MKWHLGKWRTCGSAGYEDYIRERGTGREGEQKKGRGKGKAGKGHREEREMR